jgi:putative sterol carrier protein
MVEGHVPQGVWVQLPPSAFLLRRVNLATFPTHEWISLLVDKLNSDEQYAQIARNWEGDMVVSVIPGGSLSEPIAYYLDLWHGRCRDAFEVVEELKVKPALSLSAPYENYIKLLKGNLDPIQALMTRKISLQGNFGLVMRNVLTVIDFARCCREITDNFV